MHFIARSSVPLACQSALLGTDAADNNGGVTPADADVAAQGGVTPADKGVAERGVVERGGAAAAADIWVQCDACEKWRRWEPHCYS